MECFTDAVHCLRAGWRAVKQKRSNEPDTPRESERVTLPIVPERAASSRETKEAVTFPVVGIGASAGGLAAFEAFFSGLPADADPDMAFVLVQHLAPDHKSILTDLIGEYTRMEVFEVEDGMTVRANCAYIIPPNRDMSFVDGTLRLVEPNVPRGMRLPIDFFFRSLAKAQGERAICIVLSGTGSDGTQGVRDVKAEGGMAMAQSPESAEYDGMPTSAINTGLVDFELRPGVRRHGCRSSPHRRDRDEQAFCPRAGPDRPRLYALQAQQHRPSRRAANGSQRDRND